MPVVSEAQRRAMYAAKSGHSTLGIPSKVGADFIAATPKGAKLPERKMASGGKVLKKKVVDHGDHFKVHSADGTQFTIAKRGLHPATVKHIQKMAEGGVAHYADGTGPDGASQDDVETDDATTLRHGGDYDAQRDDLSDRPGPDQIAKMQEDERGKMVKEKMDEQAFNRSAGLGMEAQADDLDGTVPGGFIDKTADTSQKLGSDGQTTNQPEQQTGSDAVKLGKFVAAKVHDVTPQEIAAKDAANAARDQNAAEQARIAGDIGKVQDEKVQSLKDLQKASDVHYAEIQKRASDLRDQIANGKIDPNHYWAEKGTGGRISASIGLLLSGLGAGLGHTENMAMKVIQSNIDRDISAQKDNLDTKKSLLADTYRETGDLRLAQQMTEHTLMNVALAQLNKFAAQSSSADVKARATVANQMANESLAQKARQIADARSANQAAAANANTQADNSLALQKAKAGDALKTLAKCRARRFRTWSRWARTWRTCASRWTKTCSPALSETSRPR